MNESKQTTVPKLFPEYDELDATGIAELVKKGDIKVSEVLEAAIERAEIRNPAINAITVDLFDRARKEADKLPDGESSKISSLRLSQMLSLSPRVLEVFCFHSTPIIRYAESWFDMPPD